MKYTFRVSPNYRDKISTGRIMRDLTLGLAVIYAFALYYYFTEYGSAYGVHALGLMATSLIVAFLTEAAWCYFTKKKFTTFVMGSYPWVTAIILTLMVPITMTYFALGFGTFFAIFFGKLVFGGFGQNIFNPAAAGRAAILASFAGRAAVDITTAATPTTVIKSLGWMIDKPEAVTKFLGEFGGLTNLFVGFYPGALGETSKVLILLVAIFLVWRKVIDWRIPVFFVGTVFVLASIIAVVKGMGAWYPLFHLATGGLMFGAVFMATDPVTNPTSSTGRILFAIGCGILTILIRVKSNLPEGVLYSILLMNMMTPSIELLTDGWQIQNIKKYAISVVSLAMVGVLLVSGVTFAMSYKEPAPVEPEKPVITLGRPVVIFSDETAKTPGVVDSKVVEGNVTTLTVSSAGYAVKDGEGGPNIFTIKIDTATKQIVSVAFATFSDTKGIGDKANSDTFLMQFAGLSTVDPAAEVDVASGATVSSVSAARGVRAAIEAVAAN
ncbi:MAG: FMN-binding protein [Erysipelotrichales bacterium]|nr:MAG: FMN-binding protein [Erysipelotrichales bacterium]